MTNAGARTTAASHNTILSPKADPNVQVNHLLPAALQVCGTLQSVHCGTCRVKSRRPMPVCCESPQLLNAEHLLSDLSQKGGSFDLEVRYLRDNGHLSPSSCARADFSLTAQQTACSTSFVAPTRAATACSAAWSKLGFTMLIPAYTICNAASSRPTCHLRDDGRFSASSCTCSGSSSAAHAACSRTFSAATRFATARSTASSKVTGLLASSVCRAASACTHLRSCQRHANLLLCLYGRTLLQLKSSSDTGRRRCCVAACCGPLTEIERQTRSTPLLLQQRVLPQPLQQQRRPAPPGQRARALLAPPPLPLALLSTPPLHEAFVGQRV